MPQKTVGSQTDFSYGEVDPDLKRADGHPARKGGLRQASNVRIHNSGTLQNRSGRSALFPTTGVRIEEITISPGNDFKLVFGPGTLQIYNSAGVAVVITRIGTPTAFPWTALDVDLIRYCLHGLQIFVTFRNAFPGMKPQVLTFDGANWTITNYDEITIGGQKRTPFYRISPQGVTLSPSAASGAITLTASAPVFTAGMVGARVRFVNRQILITAFVSTTVVNATVQENLPGVQNIAFTPDPAGFFSVGDVVRGSVTGSAGIVTIVNSATSAIAVQLTSTNVTPAATISSLPPPSYKEAVTSLSYAFTTADIVVGPAGSSQAITASAIQPPQAVTFWDEEVMNAFRGYPASCFSDQFRVGFTDFPSVPGGIAWSAINSPNDLFVGVLPQAGMFELAPGKSRIYDVMRGPTGSEFVLTDHGVFYIPISPSNPLKPGSVEFQELSGDGAAHVQPRKAQEAIIYVNAGGSSLMAIMATGINQRPFTAKSLTDYHAHLFNDVQAIACPAADGTFNERYAYVLNGDGSIVVGKYKADSLAGNEPVIGWGPWSGVGAVKWISAWQQDVLFTTSYFGATICESLNDAVYMDASLFVNALPAAFTPPAGQGPLWWIPNQSVALMDQGTRYMGIYQIDATGHIIPQNKGGENLLAATLVAGQIWSGTVEPFCPSAQPGGDAQQRLHKRQISEFAAWVLHSTGFMIAKLFSAKQTPTSPLPGAVTANRRFPAYDQGQDTTLPPTQRETVEFFQPGGSEYDPRAAVIWDSPGPLQILEIAIEVSV
jgi:hypothetical protein